MSGVNDELFDAANRHQTFLLRYGGSTANSVIDLLDQAEKDLVDRIARRVKRLGPSAKDTFQSKRLQSILGDIRAQTRDLVKSMHSLTRSELLALAKQEVDIASRRLTEAVGVDLNNFRVPPETLRTLVDKQAVGGKSLRRWFTRLGADRMGRLETAVNLGTIEGDTLGQIVKRFRDAENVTRRSARTMVRTHVNHVANQSREALYEENSDIVDGVRWTATLDGRTSSICQSRDGNIYDLDQGPRPPAHPNCRSITTPVLKSWDKLAKPGALKQGRGAKDIDALFQKNLRKQGFSAADASRIKRNTRASMNGQVPDDLTYNEWLKRQPVGFQDNVLGKKKGQLFRDGGLHVDRFVDDVTGRRLTLDTVKRQNEQAWMRVVGPDDPVEEFWDKASPVGIFHEANFSDAPTFIKEQVGRATIRLEPDNGKDSGWYQRGSKLLHMGDMKHTEDARHWEKMWVHETGHAVDDMLGGSTNNIYWSEDLAGVMSKEGTSLERKSSVIGKFREGKSVSEAFINRTAKNQGASNGKFQTLQIERVEAVIEVGGGSSSFAVRTDAQRKWAAAKLKKHGFDLDEVEEALRLDDGFDGWDNIGGTQITHFITGLEMGDIGYLLKTMFKDTQWRGSGLNVADFFGGLSKNRVGWGHSNKYYKSRPDGAQAEAFANAFVAVADTNPTWLNVYRKFAPKTMKAIEEKLKDV
jgi:SPP1 gp7 family putative phage head morphogenesis protein